ncbi:MAG TPA: hypothetical protein VJH70_02920 [Candidatus Paceibacterota bacterium]
MSSVKNSQTINPREWQRPIWITLIVCAAFWLFGLGVKYLCSEIAGWINSLFNNTPVEIVIDLGSSDINVTLEKPEQEIRISEQAWSGIIRLPLNTKFIVDAPGWAEYCFITPQGYQMYRVEDQQVNFPKTKLPSCTFRMRGKSGLAKIQIETHSSGKNELPTPVKKKKAEQQRKEMIVL